MPSTLSYCTWSQLSQFGMFRKFVRTHTEPYFNQRAACHCSSSFYHIFQSCSGWNIVSLIGINSRMFVLTLLKHTFHILQLLPERSQRIARGCVQFIILSLFFVLEFIMPSNICITLDPKITSLSVSVFLWCRMIYGLTIFMLCRQPSIFDHAFDHINLVPLL